MEKKSNKQNSCRKHKKIPPLNRHAKKKKLDEETEANLNIDSQKCNSGIKIDMGKYKQDTADDDFNLIFDFSILNKFFTPYLTCPVCATSNVRISDSPNARMGFSHKLVLECSSCAWNDSSYTSNQCVKGNGKQGTQYLK